MKTIAMMAMMMVVMFTAGFAGAADDVEVDVNNSSTNTAIATGGNANQDQDQDQNQDQDQRQRQDAHSSAIVKTPRPFLGQQYGTNFVNPGVGIENKGWSLYYSSIYAYLTVAEIETMRRHFQFSDIFFWNWKSRIQVTMVAERQSGNPTGISMTSYWPKAASNRGDKVIASITVKGDANWTEESFLGMAAQACIEEAGSDRFAVMYTTNSKGVSTGMSVSLGGAVSSVYSSGNKGAVVTSGGQIGTIETTVEEHKQFEVLCLNRGSVDLVGFIPPAPPVVQAPPAPQPPAACNPDGIWIEINELKRRIALCTQFCFNNLQLRALLGEKYIELAVCTGDKRYLSDANKNFEIAERNFKFGVDIKKHRNEAQTIMRRVYYLQAGCLNQIYGIRVATDFANKNNLEKFPTSFEQ